jgi:hypothetical protein
MKYNLQRNGHYMRNALTELNEVEIERIILEALLSATPRHVFGWFRHCGYV